MKKVLLGILYWIDQLTWGLLMTFIGAITTLFCILFLKGKVHRNGYSIITEVGDNWGGLSLGAFSFCGGYTTTCIDEDWFQQTRKHEFGHSLQNLYLGPLFSFIVSIPSAIRYHLDMKGKLKRDYYAIWFEKYATSQGVRAIDWIES